MFDPITVAGTAALSKGVSFLYDQLTDLLKRRRAHADEPDASEPLPMPEVTAQVLDDDLPAASVDVALLDHIEPDLVRVRHVLGDYADGLRQVALDDRELNEAAQQARGLLETLRGYYITFNGETGRSSSGTSLSASAMDQRVGAITASGDGAVAAHTIEAPVATGRGVAAGTIIGSVSTGDDGTDRPGEGRAT